MEGHAAIDGIEACRHIHIYVVTFMFYVVFWPNTYSCLQEGQSLSSQVQKKRGGKNYLIILWLRKVAGTVLMKLLSTNYPGDLKVSFRYIQYIILDWTFTKHLVLTQLLNLYLKIILHVYFMSTEANKFIKKLDCRRSKAKGKKGQLQEKPRVLGTPSTLPRQSGPNWALQQQEESDASVPEEERESPLREEEAMSSAESSESFSDWWPDRSS